MLSLVSQLDWEYISAILPEIQAIPDNGLIATLFLASGIALEKISNDVLWCRCCFQSAPY